MQIMKLIKSFKWGFLLTKESPITLLYLAEGLISFTIYLLMNGQIFKLRVK